MASLTPPYRVRALYDYNSPHDDDLSFPANQVISVTAEEDDDWSFGNYTDSNGTLQEGIFPRNYVEVVQEPEESPASVPPPPPRPTAKVDTAEKTAKVNKRTSTSEHVDPSLVAEKQGQDSKSFSPPSTKPAALSSQPKPPPIPQEQVQVRAPQPKSPATPSAQKPAAPKPPVTAPVVKPNPIARRPSASESQQPARSKPDSTAGKEDEPVSKPGSFRDRIAAFNKPAAAPVGPFQGSKPSGFIKKPYVPPPPSKNAYIPPAPAVQPAIIHRNDDHRPAPAEELTSPGNEAANPEDKPTVSSLKDRIALLQSMQLNPMGGAKPKKPPKLVKPKEHSAPKTSVEITDESNIQSDTISNTSEGISKGGKAEAGLQPLGYQSGDADEEEAGDVSEGDLSKDEAPPADANRAAGRPSTEKPRNQNDANESRNKEVEEAGDEEEDADEEEEEEEEEIDPEVARRLAIRERMMKMSGGMGMYGMMAAPPPPPPPAKKKKVPKQTEGEARPDDGHSVDTTSRAGDGAPEAAPARIPLFPGMMVAPKQPEPATEAGEAEEQPRYSSELGEDHAEPTEDSERLAHDDSEQVEASKFDVKGDIKDVSGQGNERPSSEFDSTTQDAANDKRISIAPSAAPPPRPPNRPPRRESTDGPPETQSPQIPQAEVVATATEGSESDDELSVRGGSVLSLSSIPPPRPARDSPSIAGDAGPGSPQSRRSVNVITSPPAPGSPLSPAAGKRSSYINRHGGIPPIPSAVSPSLPQSPASRPPPPPIPGSSPLPPTEGQRSDPRSQQSAFRYDADEEITEYEADYDTDLASGEAHKDALKAHGQDHGRHNKTDDDEEDGCDTALPSPSTEQLPTARLPGTSPSIEAHIKAYLPPQRPPSPPRPTRASTDIPRGPPPPPPHPPVPTRSLDTVSDEHVAQSPPKIEHTPVSPSGSPVAHRPSEDNAAPADNRRMTGSFRRSTDMPRPSIDHSYVAQDVDLGLSTEWWKQPNNPPPVFQNRQRDLTFEVEETSTSRRGGRATIVRDVYVLFHDYSQTIVTARYDRDDPSNATVEQKHEQPPLSLRQDQLEALSGKFGDAVVQGAQACQNSVVGDGSAFALVSEVIKSIPDALAPAGTRSFGALAYSNLGNATIQQFDEIRPGDIITFRNAKFQGHKGGLHQKYSIEVGGRSSGDHVAVVLEWDGTKKKIKVLEQGRENKKVKSESFKLGDLKSGEVKVWRVVGRGWVGWEGQSS